MISLRELGFHYRGGRETALKGVDLELDEGEFVVIMGPSRAGKSTPCTALNGLIPHFMLGGREQAEAAEREEERVV